MGGGRRPSPRHFPLVRTGRVLRRRVLEYWGTGVLEYWSAGVLEYWGAGVLEYWSTGVLEYWLAWLERGRGGSSPQQNVYEPGARWGVGGGRHPSPLLVCAGPLRCASVRCCVFGSWSTGLLESWSTEHTEPRSAHALSPIGLRPGYLDRQAPPGTSRELSKTSHALAKHHIPPGNFPGTSQNTTYPRKTSHTLPGTSRERPGNFSKPHIVTFM